MDRRRFAGADSLSSAEVRAEIEQDLAAYDAFVQRHGSPAQMLREHLAQDSDDSSSIRRPESPFRR